MSYIGPALGKAELEMPAPTPDRQKNIEKPLDLPVVFPFHRQPWRKTFAATSCSRDVLLSKYENLIVSVCYSMDDQFGSMTYLFTMVTFHCKLFYYEREHLRSTKRVPESIHLHKWHQVTSDIQADSRPFELEEHTAPGTWRCLNVGHNNNRGIRSKIGVDIYEHNQQWNFKHQEEGLFNCKTLGGSHPIFW